MAQGARSAFIVRPRRRQAFPNLYFIVLWLALLLLYFQGLFFGVISEWVVTRSLPVFDLLPWNLYPTDLLAFSLLMVAGVLAALPQLSTRTFSHILSLPLLTYFAVALIIVIGRFLTPIPILESIHLTDLLAVAPLFLLPLLWKIFTAANVQPGQSRALLLMAWWLVCIYGIFNGYLADNANPTAEIRQFFLRSFVAVAVYFIALRVNTQFLLKSVVCIGVLAAGVNATAGVLGYVGVNVQSIFDAGLYGALPLLLPYSIALCDVLTSRRPGASRWLLLGILAAGIVAPLAKPAVGAFIVCTLLGMLVTGQMSRRGLSRQIGLLVTLALAGLLVFGVFSVSGGLDDAEQAIRSRYLKEDKAVQDLSGSRFSIWATGLQRWSESPIVGHGAGYVLQGEALDLRAGQLVYNEQLWPHNILVQLLMTFGVLGVALIAVAILGWILQVRRSMQVDSPWRSLQQAMVVTAGTVMLISLYGQFIDQSLSGFVLWFALGMEAALAVRTVRWHQQRTAP